MKEHYYKCENCGRSFEDPQKGIQHEECPYCCSIRFAKIAKPPKKELDPIFSNILKGAFP